MKVTGATRGAGQLAARWLKPHLLMQAMHPLPAALTHAGTLGAPVTVDSFNAEKMQAFQQAS